MSTIDKVIVGLGNPGLKFSNTRHNAGFDVMELLAGTSPFYGYEDLEALAAFVAVRARNIVVVKPQTGMNDSGRAIAAALKRFQVKSNDLLVAYDDVSLPMGTLRFQHHGGDGGHNGLKSIFEHLGTRDFDRLKIGAGPDPGGAQRFEFVLAQITGAEKPLFKRAETSACDAALLWVTSGYDGCVRHYNGKTWSV